MLGKVKQNLTALLCLGLALNSLQTCSFAQTNTAGNPQLHFRVEMLNGKTLKQVVDIPNLLNMKQWGLKQYLREIEDNQRNLVAWTVLQNDTIMGYIFYENYDNQIYIRKLGFSPHTDPKKVLEVLFSFLKKNHLSWFEQGVRAIKIKIPPNHAWLKQLATELGFDLIKSLGRPNSRPNSNEEPIHMKYSLLKNPTPEMVESFTFYDILGLNPNFSLHDLTRAYRKRMKWYNSNQPAKTFARKAFTFLRDPDKHSSYDGHYPSTRLPRNIPIEAPLFEQQTLVWDPQLASQNPFQVLGVPENISLNKLNKHFSKLVMTNSALSPAQKTKLRAAHFIVTSLKSDDVAMSDPFADIKGPDQFQNAWERAFHYVSMFPDSDHPPTTLLPSHSNAISATSQSGFLVELRTKPSLRWRLACLTFSCSYLAAQVLGYHPPALLAGPAFAGGLFSFGYGIHLITKFPKRSYQTLLKSASYLGKTKTATFCTSLYNKLKRK